MKKNKAPADIEVYTVITARFLTAESEMPCVEDEIVRMAGNIWHGLVRAKEKPSLITTNSSINGISRRGLHKNVL